MPTEFPKAQIGILKLLICLYNIPKPRVVQLTIMVEYKKQ